MAFRPRLTRPAFLDRMAPTRLARRARAALGRSGHRVGELYRAAVTSGRFVVVACWILIAVSVNVAIPGGGGTGGGFGDLLPPDSKVLTVEDHILEKFRVPVLSGTTVVLHQDGGMSTLTRADSLLWALGTTQTTLRHPEEVVPGQVLAAIPVPTGTSQTTVTYLFMSEGTGLHNTVRLAKQYAAHFNNQSEAQTYVTGFVPAQVAQSTYLSSRLPLFELASVILIVGVVAFAFRSLLAPIAVLIAAAIGYLVYEPTLDALAGVLGFEVPSQLEPVLLALLLGVVTDYCVLFFSAFRDELDALRSAPGVTGEPDPAQRFAAARRALQHDASVVAIAGLTVAGGTIALLAAPFEIFRALGPALALTVLVGLAVCLTLTPALMAILGWRLFTPLPVRGSIRQQLARTRHRRHPDRPPLINRLTDRRTAALFGSIVIIVLTLGAIPLSTARLDLSFTAGLPGDDAVARGARLLDQAGLRGITAPTEVMLEQPDIIDQRPDLLRLQAALAQEPGVAKVLGPADYPADQPPRGLVLSEDGDAARFLLIVDSDPLAPGIVADAGFPIAQVSVTGQTLIAAEVADLTRASLEIAVAAALLIELLILILYLRAIVAPLVLLLCSTLSVAAALGLTTLLFQGALGAEGLTFYAPFASAILLIALGADYTVFSVGSIWDEARRRPLSDALRIAVPRTSRAITTAGIILAATFALVAIIPLSTFRQIAFAMSLGLLIDTLVVRPFLTPAVLTLLGRFASWPSRRVTVARPDSPPDPHPGAPLSVDPPERLHV